MKNLYTLLILLFSVINSFSQKIEVITQEQSQGTISILEYSTDGNLLVSGSNMDKVIKVWDVNSGKIIGKLSGHQKDIKGLCINPNSKEIATFSDENKIIVWNLESWSIEDSSQYKNKINSIKYESEETIIGIDQSGNIIEWIDNLNTPKIKSVLSFVPYHLDNSNELILVASKLDQLAIINSKNGKEIANNKLQNANLLGCKFINNAEQVLVVHKSGNVQILNTSLGIEKEFKIEGLQLTALSVNSLKNEFAVASKAKEIKIYNFQGEEIHHFKGKIDKHSYPIKALAISSDGSTLAGAGYRTSELLNKSTTESHIQIWDLNRGVEYKTLKGKVNPIYSFDFHPTENKLITLGEGRVLTFWNFNTADKYGDFTLPKPKREIPPKKKEITAEKGMKLLKIAKKIKDKGLNFDDIKTNSKTIAKSTGAGVLKRTIKDKAHIKYSSDGKYLFTKLPKDEIRQYSLEERLPKQVKPIFAYQTNINGILCSPKDKYLAVMGSGDSAVSIIDINTGEFNRKLKTPSPGGKLNFVYEASSMAFSSDGKYFAVCFNTGKTFVYSTAYWNLEFENTLPNSLGYVKGAFVNFSKDDKYLIVNTMLGVKAYNTSDFNPYTTGLLKISGNAVPLDKPSDYAITVKDNKLYFENTITGKVSESISVNHHNISHASVKENGDIGLTLKSGQFIIINPATGKEELLMVANGDNYIFKSAKNYYKVSKEGHDLVTFRMGNKAFPFEQFDAVFNRPDLLLTSLESNDKELIDLYEKAYLKRIKKLGVQPNTNVSIENIPITKIINKTDVASVTEKLVARIKVNFHDKRALSSFNVWINNVPMHGKKGKTIVGKSFGIDEDIPLVHGLNKIQFSCRNEDGYESLMETIYVTKKGEKPQQNLYLITIGTSDYENTAYNLNYAAKDAIDLKTLFETESNSYSAVKTKSLTNGNVTRESVMELHNFLKEAKVNDVVIVFVAGHGVLNEDFDYYFATHNMDFSNPNSKGLSYEDLESILDEIAPKKKILIMDTCHSGEVDKEEVFFSEETEQEEEEVEFRAVGPAVETKETEASPSKIMNELFNDLRRGTGATVISSAGGAEFAMESDEWQNGLFTYCLLKGLKNKEADLNKDGEIDLIELQNYVITKVKSMSGGKQIPNTRMQNLDLNFRVW